MCLLEGEVDRLDDARTFDDALVSEVSDRDSDSKIDLLLGTQVSEARLARGAGHDDRSSGAGDVAYRANAPT
jgi:hypothetical protein